MNIKRDYYLKQLINRKNNGMVKVITGMRRCGKSYLLTNIFYNHLVEAGVKEDHIIKFAFDSAKDLALINEDLINLKKTGKKVEPYKFLDFMKTKMIDKDIYYLLLDEIQELDGFEYVLNGYLREDNVDVYVTGSNAKFLSKDVITEFAGRGDEVKMLPLSFKEFLSVYDGDKREGFIEYMTYGGLPTTVLLPTHEQKANYLKNLFEETYLKDIKQRNHLRKNDIEIDDILNILSSNIGSLTNASKLSNTFKSLKNKSITRNTIEKYIEYIKDSFIIDEAKQYDVKGKKYINTPSKFYFTDLGLRNAKINFRQIEETHSLENIIFNELKLRGYSVDVGIVEQRVLDKNGNRVRQRLEIDFVANKGFNRYYIQSALSLSTDEKEVQEKRSLLKIDDSFKKIIITDSNIPSHYNEEGILIMNVFDFLLDSNSLFL